MLIYRLPRAPPPAARARFGRVVVVFGSLVHSATHLKRFQSGEWQPGWVSDVRERLMQ